jgi:hypothetical protein
MKKLSILCCVMLMAHLSRAQFQQSIGTTVTEIGRSVKATFVEPGYIVGGNTSAVVFGNIEATLIKTKPDGFIDWSAVYGRTNYETFNSVREVPYTSTPNIKPGYAALGITRSFGFGADDMYFVRTDLTGTPIFSKVFGQAKNDRGHCLQFIKDTAGYGFVMVGESNSYPYFGGTTDVYVVKTDEFGNLIRATVIGGSGNEIGYWIEQTQDLGYVIVGTTNRPCGSTIINQDIFVIRLDSNLNIVWNTIIGGGASTHADIAYGVVENPVDKSFTITGITRSFGVNNNGDAFLLNLKSTGTFNWMKTYGLNKAEIGNSIHLTTNPFTGAIEYVVGGSSTSYNATGLQDAYVFKTDVNGNLLWTALYGSKDREVVAELTDNNERGYVFAGEITAPWSLGPDVYLVKTDLNGKTGTGCERYVTQTVKINAVCQTSSAQQVFVDDNVRVESLYKRIDYKLNRCDPASARAIDDDTTDETVELQIKSNNLLAIRKNESEYRNCHIKIYDIQGKLIAEKKSTERAIEVSLEEVPSGLYIVHIVKEDGTIVRKKFMK